MGRDRRRAGSRRGGRRPYRRPPMTSPTPASTAPAGALRVGVTLSHSDAANAVDGYVALAAEAAAAGLDAVWLAQFFDVDALTIAALVGRAVPGVAVGTAAVPMVPRHPLVVAAQAQVAQAASGGRFTLGLGLSNPGIADGLFGAPFDRPIRHLAEYLTALRSVFTTGAADVRGDTLTAVTPMPAAVAGATPAVPILVGASGPQALRVAGRRADGVITLLASPGTLASRIVPAVTAAAADAGRPAPRIVAAVPALVTDDPARARAAAERAMAFYGDIPSWAAALGREGAATAADLAAIGDEAQVAGAIASYREAGATEVTAIYTHVAGHEDRRRTWALLGRLAARAAM